MFCSEDPLWCSKHTTLDVLILIQVQKENKQILYNTSRFIYDRH